MKILYLHQYFNTPGMNGSTRSYEMAKHLVNCGHEVHIISSNRNPEDSQAHWRTETIDGITVHWLAVPYSNKLSYGRRIQAFCRFALHSGRKACQIGGDIVFATSTPLTIALPAIYASKIRNIPMVFEVRDMWPEIPIAVGALQNPLLIVLARYLEKIAYRNSTRIIALSPGMASGIAATGHFKRNIDAIPNVSDIDRFNVASSHGQRFLDRHPQFRGGPLVVYTGTLGMINGVGYLVEIAHSMLAINPRVNFLIVGEGREKEAIEQKALSLNVLNTNLWLLQPVSKEEMPDVLSAATITTSLVIDIPELWNNSANKFFDGLAAGKPIMINHLGWQADLLQKNMAGIVVPPNDAPASASLLNDFLSDEKRCLDAGEKALSLAKTEFAKEILTSKLSQILEETANKKEEDAKA